MVLWFVSASLQATTGKTLHVLKTTCISRSFANAAAILPFHTISDYHSHCLQVGSCSAPPGGTFIICLPCSCFCTAGAGSLRLRHTATVIVAEVFIGLSCTDLQRDESDALKEAPRCDPTRPNECLTYCYVMDDGSMVHALHTL